MMGMPGKPPGVMTGRWGLSWPSPTDAVRTAAAIVGKKMDRFNNALAFFIGCNLTAPANPEWADPDDRMFFLHSRAKMQAKSHNPKASCNQDIRMINLRLSGGDLAAIQILADVHPPLTWSWQTASLASPRQAFPRVLRPTLSVSGEIDLTRD